MWNNRKYQGRNGGFIFGIGMCMQQGGVAEVVSPCSMTVSGTNSLNGFLGKDDRAMLPGKKLCNYT